METSWKQDKINYPANGETRMMIQRAILAGGKGGSGLAIRQIMRQKAAHAAS